MRPDRLQRYGVVEINPIGKLFGAVEAADLDRREAVDDPVQRRCLGPGQSLVVDPVDPVAARDHHAPQQGIPDRDVDSGHA